MEIKDFIQEQARFITDEEKNVTSLRCIDDRYASDHAPLPLYAVPGAGLGIVTDVIAGFEHALSNREEELTAEQVETIYTVAHTVVGTPTFHTGANHDSTCCSAAEGCGYLAKTLEGQTIVSKKTADYLKSKAAMLIEEGYAPVHFSEKHDASFVLFIQGDAIFVEPTAQDGTRAYIVHSDVRTKLLQELTEKAYIALQQELTVSLEIVVEAVHAVSATRFGAVAETLPAASGRTATQIPHYMVSNKQGVISYDLINYDTEAVQQEVRKVA